MKLSILLAGSILTSAIAGNVYAQTCGDYGYLTSGPVGIECSFEQCSGKYFPTVKCASGYTDNSDASCSWYKYWIPCSVAPERPSRT